MKNQELRAVVFDVDGMLLDTKEFIFQAYEDTLKRFGHQVPHRTVMSKQIGRGLEECYLAFAPNGDIKALSLAHRAFQDRPEIVKLIVTYPGVSDLLQQLQKAGLRLAVFSSRKVTLAPSLQRAGLIEFFGAMVQGDDVTHHKPHPEGLLKALDELGVPPHQAAMVGDAAVDILAGKAAGVSLTIGITHGFGTQTELEAAMPDYIVHSIDEIAPILLTVNK